MAGAKLCCLLYCLLHCLLVVCESSLYDDRDFVVELNATNFETSLVDSSHSWIIEFYNRWCGHCINFAPTWKTVANDTRAWRKIITVAALDCAEETNLPLCRRYGVNLFPTIKFFQPHASSQDMGVLQKGLRSEQLISEAMIDFVETTTGALDFSPIKVDTLSGLFEELPSSIKNVVVIAEKNGSYLGKEVMLDFHEDQTARIFRTLDDNLSLLQALNVTTFPSVAVVAPDFNVKYYNDSSSSISHQSVGKFISSLLHPQNSVPVVDAEGAGHKPQENEEKIETDYSNTRTTDHVYMVDLENAIAYSIRHEVALHQSITGEKLDALKNFVSWLSQNFPGRLPIMNFLSKLDLWLQKLTAVVVDDYIQFINSSQSSDIFLPPQQPWMGCKGSVEGLRGYPCSLWVLFHTVTVAAFNSQGQASDFDPVQVVSAFAGYVKHFFSCEECSLHFQEMSANLHAEIVQPDDSVLWPWNAHNKVNARLHGDASEDPQHMKIQFPPQLVCPNCRDDLGSKWDKSLVLRFLKLWYSRPSINMTGVAPIPNVDPITRSKPTLLSTIPQQEISISNTRVDQSNTKSDSNEPQPANLLASKLDVREPEPLHHSSNHNRLLRSSWGFSALDMSLCLVLYLCSAAILLVVYFVVIVKRKLRKKAYQQIAFAFV